MTLRVCLEGPVKDAALSQDFVVNIRSLKPTYDLKMDGWKTFFLLTWPIFSGHLGFREDTQVFSNTPPPIRFWMMYVKNFPVCSHQDAVWKDTGGQLQGARC